MGNSLRRMLDSSTHRTLMCEMIDILESVIENQVRDVSLYRARQCVNRDHVAHLEEIMDKVRSVPPESAWGMLKHAVLTEVDGSICDCDRQWKIILNHFKCTMGNSSELSALELLHLYTLTVDVATSKIRNHQPIHTRIVLEKMHDFILGKSGINVLVDLIKLIKPTASVVNPR